MAEEEEREFDTFSLTPVTVPKRSWRAQEDSRDSQAHDVCNTSQTRPVITQVVAGLVYKIGTVRSEIRSDSEINPGPACESAHFPVLVPQVMVKVKVKADQLFVRPDDLDSLYMKRSSHLT